MNLSADLQRREIIKQITHPELLDRVDTQSLCLYCGFDPTSDSLHVGSLLPLLLLRRFQLAGHRPIAVVGGATGMVGDPSGKGEERKLLSSSEIDKNLHGISQVISQVLDLKGTNAVQIINNAQWFSSMMVIDFLRMVGKYFTINHMLAKESVRARLEDREHGISYTEFSYMLIQAYDFYYLFKKYKCQLQIGGSDQWGNITAGIDLIRKIEPPLSPSSTQPYQDGTQMAYGLTHPLVLRSDGLKFGKTEKGTIWLSPSKTSPFEFYQFFIKTSDADVIPFLKYFTFLSYEVILELQKATQNQPEKREAQLALATEVTQIIHGPSELQKVLKSSQALFSEDIQKLDEKTLLDVLQGAPCSLFSKDRISSPSFTLCRAVIETQICSSKGMARKEIAAGGIYVNNIRMVNPELRLESNLLIAGCFLVLRKGKKNYHLLKFE